MDKNIWKEVIGYEGYYQININGDVKSLITGKILKRSINKYGYYYYGLYKNSKQKKVLVHRLIAIHYIDNHENKPFIDHINGDKKDNRIENLRWCTNSENQKNKKPRGSSGYLGVSKHSQKYKRVNRYGELKVLVGRLRYIAHIRHNGKYIHLGLFDCQIEAAKAYDKAALLYHGEFANLNFKSDEWVD